MSGARVSRVCGSARRVKIRRRRHRMAAALGRAGSDDDDSGTRALLRRDGAAQERALDADAELHPGRDRVDSMGAVRLQPRVRARQRFGRGTFVGGTPRCQRRAAVSRLFRDRAASGVHDLPMHVCRDHATHHRRDRGENVIQGVPGFQHPLDHSDLRSAGALGMGRRRMDSPNGRARFCRRHGSSYLIGHRRTRRSADGR